ncbi:unnamed protein product [Larinioides sclopetarius]|uniref:Alpha-latrotoxin n=1 Tax=Larinioides sclopetarius TaxID=280406 RepID=A0AAV2APG3_9ARAC
MGDTPLHIATLTEHLETVNALLKNGADVNAKNEAGIASLQNAAGIGSFEIVEYLIKHGADINVSDYRKLTPLMVAAKYGHLPVTKLLAKNGAFVNSKDKFGFTPLHFAAERGHQKVVEFLLKHGAIINCTNNASLTALHLSASGGHEEVVEVLLKEGADVDGAESTTPLHLAAKHGYQTIVDLLISKGANISSKNENGSTPMHLAAFNANSDVVKSLMEKGADIRTSDANETTPLCLLIARRLSGLLTLERRDVYSSDGQGFTLLHHAALAGDRTLVEYCIENRCDINSRSKYGSTALHLAAQGNHPKTVSLLLNKGAGIDANDGKGQTPLLSAVGNNCKDSVKVLVSHDVNLKTADKIEALQQSLLNGYCDIVEILLENYRFDIGNEIRRKLLNIAAHSGNKYVVAILLRRGFDVNGLTEPLNIAVENKHYEMVEFLLENGANPMLSDEKNVNPLYIAALRGYAEMAEILLSEEADVRIEREVILFAAERAVRENHLEVLKLLLQMKIFDADAKDKSGSTLLHTSALYGSLDVTIYLVEEGANVNAKDERELKPVHIATEKGFKDIVEFYLNCKDLGEKIAELLLIAVNNGKADVCELLIERNADVNECHADGETPINLALKKGHKEVLSVLLHFGAYYNANQLPLSELANNKEVVPILTKVKELFTAVQHKASDKLKSLLAEEGNSKYCLANAKCVKKGTVLHYASLKGYEEIVDILLKHNTNPNAADKTGCTPLHYAAKFSHFEIVKSLLSNGAIFNALSQSGKTPLEFAADRKILEFLLLIRNIFKKVQDNDPSVLENLKGKDECTMRAVIRAKNHDEKSLIEVAYIRGFSKTNQLQTLFVADLEDLILAQKFAVEKRYTEAFTMFERLLERRMAIFGAESHPVLDVKVDQSKIFQRWGELDKAMHFIREVHECRKKSLGEDHVKTLSDETKLAVLLSEQGETREALKIFEAIHIKLKDKMKPDDLEMIDFEMTFSVLLFKMQKFDEVLKMNREVKQKCAQKKYEILLAFSLYLTAMVLSSQGNYSEALRLYKEVYETRMVIFSPHHSSTLRALTQVASVLYLQKEYDECLAVYEKVLEIQKSLLPADCIDVLETEFRVGEVLYSQKMHLTALQIFSSLEAKIAAVAPNSGLLKETQNQIANIKYDLSLYGFQFMYDAIRDKASNTLYKA